VPFLLSSHGMVEPWLWNSQGSLIKLKKTMYWNFLAKKIFSKASVVHAITSLEADRLSKLLPGAKIEIIPNAIDVSMNNDFTSINPQRRILFLGRIEPKKGVDLLIHAFNSAKLSKEWILDIVGPVWSEVYLKYLKQLVVDYKLESNVIFHGPLFGIEKKRLINLAWILAAPSHSEVIGLVNLEAAINSLPSITTYQTGLNDWESGGGKLINPNIQELTQSLVEACSWDYLEQRQRGRASYNLVLKKYSWGVIAPRWLDLYSSILNL